MSNHPKENSKEWIKFVDLCLSAKDRGSLDMILRLFTTMDERDMLISRYQLVKVLLTTDLSQREIAETLHLSISKVTAGSKATQRLPELQKAYLIKKMS